MVFPVRRREVDSPVGAAEYETVIRDGKERITITSMLNFDIKSFLKDFLLE
jgi:hypothetical protein